MQRLVVSSAAKLRSSAVRRTFSSSNNKVPPNVGTIKRRSKPSPARAAPGSPEAEQEIMSASVSQEVTGEVVRNNVLLASALVAFCAGVMWYSMHAVGQSGSSEDDPLAALKEEASAAQAARDNESRQSNEATDMLKQFESGAFDPDRLEEEEEAAKPKKPWWKIW
eukprot:scaffold3405_cov167-Amphora_coffeaeformis.AAC.8